MFLKNIFHLKKTTSLYLFIVLFLILIIFSPSVKASNYAIIVSDNPDRSNTMPLEQKSLAGLAYIHVMDDSSIDKVVFYLNTKTGTPYQTENNAPYDMKGGNSDGTARAFDTTDLPDGKYFLHVKILLKDGSTVKRTAYFNIINSSSLVVSLDSARSNPDPLESSTLRGLVYIHVMDDPDIDYVNFYLDSNTGSPYQTENNAPYDMAGGYSDGTAKAFDTTSLQDGSHTIFASIVLSDGSEITDIAYFNVNNSPSSTDYVFLDIHINGQGSVTELNSGLECRDRNCSFKFEAGTLVHLSATAASNTDEFSAWEGICERKDDCIFSIDYDNAITATFNEQYQDTQSKSSSSFTLVYHNNPDRDNPYQLQSSYLSGDVYIELLSDIKIKQVAFFLDSSPDFVNNARQIENNAPYDFSGSDSNNKPKVFDTSFASSGSHTLFALITLEDGTEIIEKSEFTITDTDNMHSSSDKNTISWVAPTERESGIGIIESELEKFIIYYGTRSKTYTGFIEISKNDNNELPTSVSVDHLEQGIVYYFSGITVDTKGLRSIMSNEISRLIEP